MSTVAIETLYEQLLAQVDSDEALTGEAGELVLAACQGPDALAHALDPTQETVDEHARAQVPEVVAPAYLRSITVEGFRGIGKAATLDLTPGNGLTLVVGRNGSGKSSFAVAIELVLTGENARWADRTAVWKDGWRSLHHSPARIRATFVRDGIAGDTVVTAEWADATRSVGDASVEVKPAVDGGMSGLGWDEPLDRYRPFLSYSELGRMFERPSALYESLNAVLGLGRLDEMLALLSRARIDADNGAKALRTGAKDLSNALAQVEDPRAAACRAALQMKPPDIDELELLLDAPEDSRGDLPLLRSLAALRVPDEATVAGALTALGDATAKLSALEASDAGRAAQLASLLEQALATHDHEDDACKVCHGALPDAWRMLTEAELARLRVASAEYELARRAVADLLPRAVALVGSEPPAVVQRGYDAGFDPTRAIAAWSRWSALVKQPLELPGKGAGVLNELRTAVGEIASAAAARIAEVEDAWRPLARALGDWLPAARRQEAQAARLAPLKQAETWLLGASGEIREERLAPIRDAAIATWNQLRHESSISLGTIKLSGKGKARHAEFDVKVDDSGAAALGVMSQGELHALALSVFLPRAMRDESPFRFVMIDDPVQSMDPAKVDGLARVLAAAAETRQVIVFTHDERLAEATRRLKLGATTIQVHRGPGSDVETRIARSPAEQAIGDARALLRDENVSQLVRRRVVPAFCREALEATCAEVVRRRRLGRGDPRASVEQAILDANKLYKCLALALFDDADRTGDVLTRINNAYGSPAGDAIRRCNAGAHGEDAGVDLEGLVSECARLSAKLAA
jgi:energy-coupling factor transporter ATP-binding protein EcfA2